MHYFAYFDQPRQHIKKQRHYFVNKSLSGQGYGFLLLVELTFLEAVSYKILVVVLHTDI